MDEVSSLSRRVRDRVRAELLRQNMSQAALARALDTSEMFVGRRLRGEVPFDTDEIEKIAHVLDIAVEDLVAPPGQMRFSA